MLTNQQKTLLKQISNNQIKSLQHELGTILNNYDKSTDKQKQQYDYNKSAVIFGLTAWHTITYKILNDIAITERERDNICCLINEVKIEYNVKTDNLIAKAQKEPFRDDLNLSSKIISYINTTKQIDDLINELQNTCN